MATTGDPNSNQPPQQTQATPTNNQSLDNAKEAAVVSEKKRQEMEKMLDLEVRLTALANDKLDRYIKINEQLKIEKEAAEKLLELKSKEISENETILGQLGDQLGDLLTQGGAAAGFGDEIENIKQLMREYQDKIDIAQEDAALQLKKIQNLKAENEEFERANQRLKKRIDFNKDLKSSMEENMQATVGLNSVFTKGLIDGLTPFQAGINAIKAQFQKLFDDVMQGNQKFAATTGQIANRSIGFGYGMAQFGVGFKEMNESMIDLYTSMSDFSNLNTETQEKLAGTASKLKLIGVSGAVAGQTFDVLNKSLKMTAEEAAETTNMLAKEAIGAGIAPSKMLSEFGPAMGKLSAYGEKGIRVFVDMQKAAKSLGVEMSTLTSIIGDQFDTFEDSAKAAGKLNAVLGGDFLNSVDMLNATESERIIMLKKSFDQSGKNFDQLSKYEKKAIASALGIKDLNEANKILGKDTYTLERDMAAQAVSQEKLEAIQREAAETTKQLSEVFNLLLIAARPLVAVVKLIAEGLGIIIDFFTTNKFGMVLGTLISIVFVVKNLSTAITILKTAWNALDMVTGRSTIVKIIMLAALAFGILHDVLMVPKSPILLTVLMALPDIIQRIGEAAEENVKGLMALGAATALIGLGIKFAAGGLAELVSSFKGLGDAAPYAAAGLTVFMVAFTLMVFIMAKLAPVSGIAALGVLAMGAAILMLGAGISLAASGMKDLVGSIVQLGSSLTPETILGIEILSFSILALAGAAVLMLIGSFGVKSLASAIRDVKEAILEKGGTDVLKGFGDSLTGLYNLLMFDGLEDAAKRVVNAIGMIGEEINKVSSDGDKIVRFNASMNSINNVLTTAKTIREEDIKPTKELLNKAKEYYIAQAGSKDTDKDALFAIVKELQKINQTNNSQRNTGPIKVKLVVGNNEADALLYGFNTRTSDIIQG